MTQRVLASLRLPIPLDALDAVGTLVERAYGTGATMMQADGETIHILEPEDGLGERHRAGPSEITTRESSDMLLRYLELRDGEATVSIEDSSNAVLLVSEVMHRWFEQQGGINYVELSLHHDQDDERPQVSVHDAAC